MLFFWHTAFYFFYICLGFLLISQSSEFNIYSTYSSFLNNIVENSFLYKNGLLVFLTFASRYKKLIKTIWSRPLFGPFYQGVYNMKRSLTYSWFPRYQNLMEIFLISNWRSINIVTKRFFFSHQWNFFDDKRYDYIILNQLKYIIRNGFNIWH